MPWLMNFWKSKTICDHNIFLILNVTNLSVPNSTMKKNLTLPALAVFVCLLMVSCVKDTDFDQAQDITAEPVVELNLIHFDLQGGEFYDTSTNNPRLTVRDTTEIRFLDDTSVQESLLRADFLFRFTNSISRSFVVDFQFLTEMGDTTYTAQVQVAIGSPGAPVVTEEVIIVEGDEITQLTMADRVVVSVTVPSSEPEMPGNLNLQSKTTYYLEITERE